MVAAGVKEDVYAAAGGLPLGSQLAEALVKQGVQSRHGSGHLATVRPARAAPCPPPTRSAWTGSGLGSAPPRDRPPAPAAGAPSRVPAAAGRSGRAPGAPVPAGRLSQGQHPLARRVHHWCLLLQTLLLQAAHQN